MKISYIRWSRSVNEEKVCVFDSCLDELLSIILSFIQPNNMSHIEVFKDLEIVLWLIASSLSFVIDRTHECNKFLWNDPV